MRTSPTSFLIVAPALAMMLSISGCAPLKTTRWDESVTTTKKGVGQFYFLPKARITIVGSFDKDRIYSVTVTKDLVPDKSSRYFVAHSGNWMYEDAISLGVNSDGLLDGDQKADVKDKLPETITTLADTFVSAWKISATGGAAFDGETPFKPFQVSFSPGEGLSRVNATLEKAGFEIDEKTVSTVQATRNRTPGGSGDSGLLYRPPTVYHFTLISRIGYDAFSRQTSVSIPNPGEVALLPVKRMGFVDLSQKGTFESGQLKRVEITQPSPVLGVVSIPNKIIGSVANAIGGIFDNRAKARADDKASALAQGELELAKLKAEKDIADARNALNPPSSAQALKAELEQEAAIKRLQSEIKTLNEKLAVAGDGTPAANGTPSGNGVATEEAKGGATGVPAVNAGGTAGEGPVGGDSSESGDKKKSE